MVDLGSGNTSAISTGNDDEYEITYNPSTDWTGITKFSYKYYSGVQGQASPKYIDYIVEVKESIVAATNDFVYFPSGSSDVVIDVLNNDTTTADSLSNVSIAQVTNGTAIVNAQNEIVFTPSINSDFTAFIQYVAEDNLGGFDLGTVSIQADDVYSIDTLRFKITNERSFSVLLPDDSCIVTDSTDFGDLIIDGNSMLYTPDEDSEGLDIAKLSDGNNDLIIEFEVIDLENPTKFVQNDYLFVPMNSSIDFDVFENDFDPEDASIVDYSGVLTHDSLGLLVTLHLLGMRE